MSNPIPPPLSTQRPPRLVTAVKLALTLAILLATQEAPNPPPNGAT